jgi:outer membrane scaffolding protein for murein synthesis (MipA/OmpV family)
LQNIDLSVSGPHLINENWTLGGKQKLGIEARDAADSPPSDNRQPAALFSFDYRL